MKHIFKIVGYRLLRFFTYFFFLIKPSLYFILLGFYLNIHAQVTTQQEYLDSLIGDLKNAPKDSNKVLLLEKIGHTYSSLDSKKGLEYAIKANKLAVELKLKNREASSLTIIGINYAADLEHDKAIEYYRRAIDIYESSKDISGMATVNSNLSLVYLKLGNYSKALECNFNALKYFEDSEEYRNKGVVLENIAGIYYELKEFAKSEKYYLKALKLFKKVDSEMDIARSMGNISRVSLQNGDYDKAMKYLNDALIINEKNGNKRGVLINLTNIGNVYSKKELYDEALDYFYQSLEISEKLILKNYIAINKGNIGETYLKMFKRSNHLNTDYLTRSISNLNEAILICESIQFIAPKIEFAKGLIEAYELNKDYKTAYELLKKNTELEDSLFSLESKESLAHIESKLENDLKDKDIIIKNKELEIYKLGVDKKTLFYTWAISVLILILFIFLRYFFRKVKQHKELISQIKQTHSHDIRGPVATILGLSYLLKEKNRKEKISDEEIIDGIQELAKVLDERVLRIIKDSKSYK